MNSNLDNCLAKILNAIKILQNNSREFDCNDTSCTKPYLGPNPTYLCFNTRPIMLYRCDNSPVTLEYQTSENETATTDVFRVESVTNDSVGVLLLNSTTDNEGNRTFTTTNNYATINLNCICAIKCLNDTIVNNI